MGLRSTRNESAAKQRMIEKVQASRTGFTGGGISLRQLVARFRWQITWTWVLVVVEAALMLMFPLLLGVAIDGMRQQKYSGLYLLGGLGALSVLVGSARRFYDTRVYSRIYAAAGSRIVERERDRKSGVSVISARTNMARELVEFLETSFPAIVDCAIGLVGTLAMIWLLQAKVFAGCLIGTAFIIAIYAVAQKTTYALNKGINHESEKQVHVLSNEPMSAVSAHFGNLMRWNIRLSDLETATYAVSWFVMIVVLLYAVAVTIHSGVTAHGAVLSILMYVFGYIESLAAAPLFYQQFVRLQEISHRLVGDSV